MKKIYIIFTFFFTCLSFGQSVLSHEDFTVYPNPVTGDIVNIKSSTTGPVEVFVFDVLGKQVISEIITNNRLRISRLKPGVYILRITQNDTTETKKLVIK